MLYTHAAALLLGLAIGGAGAWKVQTWRHAEIELERAEHRREVETQRRQANQGVTDRVVQDRRKQDAAAAAARTELDRLRELLDRRAEPAEAGPGADEAPYRELLGECSAEATRLAAEADRLASQVRGLQSYAVDVCLIGGR